MAGAIIDGAASYDICLYDTDVEKYGRFIPKGHTPCDSIAQAVEKADYIFLCVKPQVAPAVLPEIASCDLGGKVVISIMAGITLATLTAALGENAAIIRTMPNTPLMLGKGVTALCRNEKVNDRKFSDICRLFSEMGEVMVVTEDMSIPITSAYLSLSDSSAESL